MSESTPNDETELKPSGFVFDPEIENRPPGQLTAEQWIANMPYWWRKYAHDPEYRRQVDERCGNGRIEDV